MKHPDDLLSYIDNLKTSLDSETISLLDLDELRTHLDTLSDRLAAADTASEALDLLRRDYIDRIAGMLKAIAASDRSHNALRRTLDEIDSLSSLSSEQLIRRYRTVAARFRDHFPTSFGPMRAAGQRGTDHTRGSRASRT